MRKIIIPLFISYLLSCSLLAQTPAIKVTLLDFSVTDSFGINIPIYAKLRASGSNNDIDTNYTNSVEVSVFSGPGSISGSTAKLFDKGEVIFNDLKLSVTGWYQLEFSSASLTSVITDSFYVYSKINFGNIPANKMMLFGQPSSSINSPFYLYAIAIDSSTYTLDTTYNSSIILSMSGGSGSLTGDTSFIFLKGIALFIDIAISDSGTYQLTANSNSLSSADFNITIYPDNNSSSQKCNTASIGYRKNLGIYAGLANDLCFSKTDNRIFAGVLAPTALYYSDDSCKSWKTPFPYDSLEFECGERGWGGSCKKILSNSKGWISALTAEPLGTLNSSVISFSNGDSGSWKTAMDAYLLSNSYGYSVNLVNTIELTDYYMFSLLGPYIVKISDQTFNSLTDITDIRTINSGIDSNSYIHSMATSNNANAYPYYIAIDTLYDEDGFNRKLYRFDGNLLSLVSLPTNIDGIVNVFTHNGQQTGDTIFISAIETLTEDKVLFRSFDSGTSWTEISVPNKDAILSKVDYASSWLSILPLSNGLILQATGSYYSYDLGNTWLTTNELENFSVSSFDTNFVVGGLRDKIANSYSGASSSFTKNINENFEVIEVRKIARNNSKNIFYLATNFGIAYTTAYLNNSIHSYERWTTPFGEFPISINGASNFSPISISINPYDSLHVIACGTGFALSATGPNGFNYSNPSSQEITFMDVAFVNSTIIIAVSSYVDSLGGDIWQSADGGNTWAIVSPSGFSNGRCIAVGYANNDTVVYIGSGLKAISKGALWKSIDKGLSWTQINTGPESQSGNAEMDLPINDIAIDPRSNDTIYIAAGQNTSFAWVRSTDGGANFDYIDTWGEGAFSSVMVDNNNPDSVYAAIRREIHVYDALTNDTAIIFRGLPGELIPELVNGSILIGTTTGFYNVGLEPFDDIVGIKNVINYSNIPSVIVYPNPTTSQAFVELYTTENISIKIRVHSLLGYKIYQEYMYSLNKNEKKKIGLDLSSFIPGTYLITIESEHSIQTTKAIVIPH